MWGAIYVQRQLKAENHHWRLRNFEKSTSSIFLIILNYKLGNYTIIGTQAADVNLSQLVQIFCFLLSGLFAFLIKRQY